MQRVDLTDTEYAGGLSSLTRYGTMNVSEARIPRKRRGRGNAALHKDRTTARGYADTPEGIALAAQGIASVKVEKDGTTETVSAHSFRKGRTRTSRIPRVAPALKQNDLQRFAGILGSQADYD